MKLLIVDDQSTVVQGLLHCTNWAAMGFTVVDTALNAVAVSYTHLTLPTILQV